MAEHKEKYDCDDDGDECQAVQGCKKGRPVKVHITNEPIEVTLGDCDPIPVKIEDCDPLPVKIKQEHCDPLIMRQHRGDCWRVSGCDEGLPVKVTSSEDDCLYVQGCADGIPVHVVVDNPTPPAENDNQFVFNGDPTSPNGGWEPLRTPSKFVPLDNIQISGTQVVWTPAVGKKFRLMGFQFTSSLAGQVDFRDGVGGTIIYSIMVAAGAQNISLPLGNGILSAAANTPLVMDLAGGPGPLSFVSGVLVGQEVP